MKGALVALMLAACAAAPTPVPVRELPPEGEWSRCGAKCDSEGSAFIGLMFPSAFVSAFVCVCSLRPGPERHKT